jgi:hypothetical protein
VNPLTIIEIEQLHQSVGSPRAIPLNPDPLYVPRLDAMVSVLSNFDLMAPPISLWRRRFHGYPTSAPRSPHG